MGSWDLILCAQNSLEAYNDTFVYMDKKEFEVYDNETREQVRSWINDAIENYKNDNDKDGKIFRYTIRNEDYCVIVSFEIHSYNGVVCITKDWDTLVDLNKDIEASIRYYYEIPRNYWSLSDWFWKTQGKDKEWYFENVKKPFIKTFSKEAENAIVRCFL